jgi:hypothetical protein
MTIPTEPIGSIPRPTRLIAAAAECGDYTDPRAFDKIRSRVLGTALAAKRLGLQ